MFKSFERFEFMIPTAALVAGQLISISSFAVVPSASAKTAHMPTQVLRGADGSGGGFVGLDADRVLWRAKKESASLLTSVQDSLFDSQPGARKTMTTAIRTANFLVGESRVREGRALILDYDVAHQSITVLKPFADEYANLSNSEFEGAVKATEVRLIHEAAHLVGITNDEDAEEVAQRITSTDMVTSPFDGTVDLCTRIKAIATADDSLSARTCMQAVVQESCGSDHVLNTLVSRGDWEKFRDYSWQMLSSMNACVGDAGSHGLATGATRTRVRFFSSDSALEQAVLENAH